MYGFFKPWRRKIGVVTLVMACVFAAGWIRSRSYHDTFFITRSDVAGQYVESLNGFILYEEYELYEGTLRWPASAALNSQPLSDFDRAFMFHNIKWKWDLRWLRLGRMESAGNEDMAMIAIHYWILTASIATLSAYLLLSKSPQVSPKPTTEPAPTTGT